MMRLELSNGWSIYFPTTTQTVDLTGVPIDANTTATLQAIRFGQKSGTDYQSVLRFDGDDLDDLNDVMDAFSVRPLTPQEISR